MNIFVFDIETIPDSKAGRKIYNLADDLSDADVIKVMQSKQMEKSGHDFISHYLQQIVAISVVFRHRRDLKVFTVGDETSSEKEIIQRFYAGLDKYIPQLVSWNGTGFDLPVLHYRSLLHKISAPTYWEKGDNNQSFRWNNYISRYHDRHLDLMDVLASYTGRANAPLDGVATMLGFPGKVGVSGGDVLSLYQSGNIKAIRDYCETDVLNTYLVYLRYCLLKGELNTEEYDSEEQQVKDYLEAEDKPHFHEFIEHSECWA